MIRDRLGDLKAVRKDSYKEKIKIKSLSLEFPLNEAETFLDDFITETEELSANIDHISFIIEEIKKKHSAILTVPSSSEKLKNELEDMIHQISTLSKKVRQKLKVLERELEDPNHQPNSVDFRIKKTQHASLNRRFIDIMFLYYDTQLKYKDRCKDQIKRQLEVTGCSKSNDEIEEMLESGNPAVFTKGIIMQTQAAKLALKDIENRHTDLIKLEKSIKELNEMFFDMALMIENQGELVDQIEHNTRNAAYQVRKGKVDLGIGLDNIHKARKKKIILCSVVVIVIIILGMIVYFSVK